jgi:predicted nucleic acid-binding protein
VTGRKTEGRRRAVRKVGLTLDSGALIAIERGDRVVLTLLREALTVGASLALPATVLAQVFRDPARQARLSRFLAACDHESVPFDDVVARAVGRLLAARGTSDVVDAAVVLCARERDHAVVTSDPEDLAALDPELPLIVL